MPEESSRDERSRNDFALVLSPDRDCQSLPEIPRDRLRLGAAFRSTMAKKRAIVVGAGIGGSCTAARLAQAGFSVTVVEKADQPGGRCSLIEADGHRFDAGPSFYLMPEVFEELFADLGERVEDHYTLVKCEPNYSIHFHDGDKLELSTDMAAMKKMVERYEGKDGWERFLSFMQESHRNYEMSLKEVLHFNFPNLISALKLRYLAMALRIHVFDRLHRRASNYFHTERLRRAFTFSSMYLGMSPYKAPATYNLLQYTELAQGVWYPLGGVRESSVLLMLAVQDSRRCGREDSAQEVWRRVPLLDASQAHRALVGWKASYRSRAGERRAARGGSRHLQRRSRLLV